MTFEQRIEVRDASHVIYRKRKFKAEGKGIEKFPRQKHIACIWATTVLSVWLEKGKEGEAEWRWCLRVDRDELLKRVTHLGKQWISSLYVKESHRNVLPGKVNRFFVLKQLFASPAYICSLRKFTHIESYRLFCTLHFFILIYHGNHSICI